MAGTKKRPSTPLQMFTWGYDGWGNHSEKLVEMVDAVEKVRGFAPPLFVDIRIRRAARAVGFRSGAFEEQLGPRRYRWLRGLGNRRVIDRTHGKPKIDSPETASALLDLAVEASLRNRRVLFFCSCPAPTPEHPARCHRYDVARLLLSESRKRGLSVTIQEWPGGEPKIVQLPDDPVLREDLDRGLVTLSLRKPVAVSRFGSYPLGTVLRFGRGTAQRLVVVHRIGYRKGGWYLKTLETSDAKELPAEGLLSKYATIFRRLGHQASSTI